MEESLAQGRGKVTGDLLSHDKRGRDGGREETDGALRLTIKIR